MNSYWELYVAYIDKCVRDNWINDIDPAHYEMEWNHFLPRSIFGDWPIGQWLTKPQHAIASALQTLAFERNCMFGWHKHYLPTVLFEISWEYFLSAQAKVGSDNVKYGRGIYSEEYIQSEKRKEVYKQIGETSGTANCRLSLLQKTGIHSEEYNNSGKRSEVSKKVGEENVRLKRGVLSDDYIGSDKHRETGRRSGLKTSSQVWESTVDGFRSTAGNVARHNKANGWDPDARIRIK